MSYLINSSAVVQGVSSNQSLTTALKYSLSALEVDLCTTTSVTLLANTILEIPLIGVARLHVLSIQSTQLVDYAIGVNGTTTGTAVFSTYGSNLTLRLFEAGVIATKLFLKSTVNVTCEVTYAGRLV